MFRRARSMPLATVWQPGQRKLTLRWTTFVNPKQTRSQRLANVGKLNPISANPARLHSEGRGRRFESFRVRHSPASKCKAVVNRFAICYGAGVVAHRLSRERAAGPVRDKAMPVEARAPVARSERDEPINTTVL